MKRVAVALIASALLDLGLAGCGGGDDVGATAGATTVRATEFGQIEGIVEADGNTVSWRGVPFAKPPVGTLRWQPTQAPDPWTGVRSSKDYADACSQIGGLFGPPPRGKDYSAVWETFYKQIGSEDCLYLNVWSPTGATDASKLPVIVYIHGGSNVVGAAFDPLLLGGNLAKNANAVVVTVAYRLGVFGWFANPAFNTGDPIHDSGNFALLDLIQSLKFVKNNIANSAATRAT
jgi:para-nitrobenzyl esterase